MMLFQKPFLHRISPTYFFSLNAVLAFLDCIHFIVKLKRVSAWTGKRERGMTRKSVIFQGFVVSKNVKQALLTLLHVLTVRYARKYRVGLGHERGRWLE